MGECLFPPYHLCLNNGLFYRIRFRRKTEKLVRMTTNVIYLEKKQVKSGPYVELPVLIPTGLQKSAMNLRRLAPRTLG